MEIKKIGELFGEAQSQEQQWMFAYGSLSSKKLRYLLLDEVLPVVPCRISKDMGYKRKWIQNHALKSITSGIFKDDNPVDINGIIFPMKEIDFIKLDDYEYGYKRVQIDLDILLIEGKERYEGSKIWIYIPDQEYERPEFFKSLPTIYVDYCMEGFGEVSEDYMIEFAKTTD